MSSHPCPSPGRGPSHDVEHLSTLGWLLVVGRGWVPLLPRRNARARTPNPRCARMDLSTLLQFMVNGAFISSVYALMAMGLTLIFGVMQIADFAQGALYMLGAYVSFYLTNRAGLSYFLSLPVAMLAIAGIAVLNNLAVYRPLRQAGGATTFVAALGILLILQNAALWSFGADYRLIRSPFGDGKVTLLGAVVTYQLLFIVAVTAALVLIVWLFLHRTKVGKGLRAMSQNRDAAALMGINPNRIDLVTFAIAGALAG